MPGPLTAPPSAGTSLNASQRALIMLELEFALRDFFGLIDEPIKVEPDVIANALREIASEDGLDLAASGLLMAIASSMTGQSTEWQLKLSRRQKGKHLLHHERLQLQERDVDIYIEVENLRAK